MVKYKEQYTDPIQLQSFFFNREIYEFIMQIEEDEGVDIAYLYYKMFVKYCLDNIIDEDISLRLQEYNSELMDEFNTLVSQSTYPALNDYRWDFVNGRKGGRPKRVKKIF